MNKLREEIIEIIDKLSCYPVRLGCDLNTLEIHVGKLVGILEYKYSIFLFGWKRWWVVQDVIDGVEESLETPGYRAIYVK